MNAEGAEMTSAAGPPASRAASETLRAYYGRKAAATGKDQQAGGAAQQQKQRHGAAGQPQRQPSAASKLLAGLSPKRWQPQSAAPHEQHHGPSQRRQQGGSLVAEAGIAAFRPPSPPPAAYPATDDCSSPGKAQLQAVRRLAQQQQQQQQASPAVAPAQHQRQQARQQQQQQAGQGTPGLSETSVGREINDVIASSIADLFAATPPEVCSRLQQCHQEQQQQQQQAEAEGSADQRSAGGTGGGAQQHGQAEPEELVAPEPQRCLSTRPDGGATPGATVGGALPVPPPQPARLRTAMSDSGRLEPRGSPQSFLSPVFMSRKQRSMYCEMDEPGRAIVFPSKARSRTGRLQRFVASMFGCFVPPSEQRSPAPALRTGGSCRTLSSSQGGSAALPAGLAMGNVEPLRQSLVELALGDPALREQLRASLAAYDGLAAAAGGPLGQQHQRLAGDPLGLADEDAQLNMASPVLPTRPCSACDTPAEGGGDKDAAAACRENSVAKRNLMDVLRSKESAPPARQAQQPRQPPPFVHPQQSLQHAARPQPAGGAHQQQLHLQPWQRQRQGSRPGSGGASAAAPQGRPSSAGPAKASHVSLAQLLAGPSAKQASAAAADSAQDVLRPRQAAPAGPQRPRRHNSGSKRGREALGASRPPSDDAPVFTPKQQRRDLSKPSYRSETLHQKLSPQPVRAPAAGGSGAEVPGGSQPQARRQPQPRQAAAAPGASAPAAARLKAGASVSAPVSPLRGASLVPSGLQRGAGRSVPSSPEVGVPRLNRAATVRAAASQRKLQEQQAELRAAMSKSPDRWLRAAAAEGLSLREAAVLASPGKTARPHYDPTSAPAAAAGRVAPGAAAAMRLSMATPGAGRFDAFEAGAEPYSARLHTVERQRPVVAQRLAVAAAPAPALAGPSAAAEPPLLARGGGLDFARLAADRDAYLQMLQMLAQGHQLADGPPRQQLEAHKQPRPAPLQADLLAAAAAASRQERLQQAAADGADTVRPREAVNASQETLASSRTAGSAAEYSLDVGGGDEAPAVQCAEEEPRRRPHQHVPPPVALTPHHNMLFDKDATPTKSSPVAQQRLLSMSAAAAAQWAEQQQAPAGATPASSGNASISFGSGGCGEASQATLRQAEEQTDESCSYGGVVDRADPQPTVSKPARPSAATALSGVSVRLAGLARLLEEAQAEGRHVTLPALQAAGYSSHDVMALKALVLKQQ